MIGSTVVLHNSEDDVNLYCKTDDRLSMTSVKPQDCHMGHTNEFCMMNAYENLLHDF